jgi:hypothetical protein
MLATDSHQDIVAGRPAAPCDEVTGVLRPEGFVVAAAL